MTELSVTLPLSGLGPVDYSSSRVAAIAPLHELTWSSTLIATNGATRYAGNYYSSGDPALEESYAGAPYVNLNATFGEQGVAYVNCLLFSGYTVISSSVHGIDSIAAPNSGQWPNLWVRAADVGYNTVNNYSGPPNWGNWILLTCPDGVSQLCIIRTHGGYREHLYFIWSPGGTFSGGSGITRPFASDEILIDGGQEYLSNGVNYFYAFRGHRELEITSRILVTHSPGAGQEQILRLLCFERFVTDIPEVTYARNVCMMSWFTGYYHYPTNKNSDSGACYTVMPDGKQAWHCCFGLQTTQYWGSQNCSDNKGTLDGKYRLEPFQLYKAASSDGNVQFFGYLPDLYWGETKELTAAYKTYTFNGIWKQIGPLVFPVFECATAQNVSDVSGLRLVSRTPGKTTAVDVTKPVFAGIVSAEPIGDNTVRLTWESGSDSVTADENLRYEIHFSTQPGAPFEVRDLVTGNG